MDDRDVRVSQAQREADLKYHDPSRGIVGVHVGFPTRGGVMDLDSSAIVFSVVRKKTLAELRPSEVLPQFVGGVPTDVIETGEITVYRTSWVRPVAGGWSVGHLDVTAGTLGAWVGRRGDPDGHRYILSNNHVLANSNDARPGDIIVQPGVYDGGTIGTRIGLLTELVYINFMSFKKFGWIARTFWSVAKWVPNTIARLLGCPIRLAIQQPSTNWVDAAIARSDKPEDVLDTIEGLGKPVGFRDLVLGDQAHKSGRTTAVTTGLVVGTNGSFTVGYGSGKTGRFGDQLVVGGEFSRPGDSGSAVLTDDNNIGGLLFAGGTGITIVNKISHVVRLLSLEL